MPCCLSALSCIQGLNLKVADQAERIHHDVAGELVAVKKALAEEKHEHSEAIKILNKQFDELNNKVAGLNKNLEAAGQRETKLAAEVEKLKKAAETQKKKLAGKTAFSWRLRLCIVAALS